MTKNNRIISMLAAFVIMTSAFYMPAMAYASETDRIPIDTSQIYDITNLIDTSENPEPSESTTESAIPDNSKPFTPDGQATVVDLAYESDGKMFYTFKTPAGNVFYIIIDRELNSDNVYFLNAVTEADLLALAEKAESKSGISAIPTVEPTTVEPTQTGTEKNPASENDKPPTEKKSNMGMIIFVIIGVLAVGGVAYYMKIVRPKQQAGMDDEDDDVPDDDSDKEIEFEDEPEETDGDEIYDDSETNDE